METNIDQQLAAIAGLGLGTVLAVVCSWQRNRSILWAIIHSWFTWGYVIWFALTRRPDEVKSSK